jgi:hypothetical protein
LDCVPFVAQALIRQETDPSNPMGYLCGGRFLRLGCTFCAP